MTFPVVILAGGLATRMRPMTETLPKALLPVNGRPFADVQLEWLSSLGVKNVIFSVGYRASQIQEHVGDGSQFDLSVEYVSDGPTPLGTGGALRAVVDAGVIDEVFAVINGDSFLTLDIAAIEAAFLERQKPALMTVMHNRNLWGPSNVICSNGDVTLYDKRASAASAGMEWIDYGYWILRREVVTEGVTPSKQIDMSDVLHELSVEGKLAGFEVEQRFYEIGSTEGLQDLEDHLTEL